MEHHRKFTLEDRRIIARMVEAKARIVEIAEAVGKHRSSVYREIKRNFWNDEEYPIISGYWHMTAQSLAAKRYERRRKLVRDGALRDAVIDRLKEGWSPEQIAGRLMIEPGLARVCHALPDRALHSNVPRRRRSTNLCTLAKAKAKSWLDICQNTEKNGAAVVAESPEVLCFLSIWRSDIVPRRSTNGKNLDTGLSVFASNHLSADRKPI